MGILSPFRFMSFRSLMGYSHRWYLLALSEVRD